MAASPIELEINKTTIAKSTPIDCHLLPCQIKNRCTTPVDKLFPINSNEETPSVLEASFRGRQLKGKEMELPNGFTGVILSQSCDEDENPVLKNTCKKITYWNWDKNPTANDSFLKMMDWIKISNAIHSDD